MSLRQQLSTPLAKQLWVVIGAYFTTFGNGMLLGVSNCMMPALLSPNSTISVDINTASWINGSIGISCVLSYVASSFLMSTCGRRLSTLMCLIPPTIGPVICYFASDIKLLIFGRFLGGIGFGALALVEIIVVSEYTAPKYRGVFLNLKSCMIPVGFTFAHVLGNYFHWRTVILVVGAPFGLNFLMALTWPESPSWLATQKRYEEALEAFYWLRGKSEQATNEINSIIEAEEERKCDKDDTVIMKLTSFLMKFRKKTFLKPLGIYSLAAVIMEVSGRHIFPAYAVQIIQQINNNKSNEYFYTMCLDFMNFSCFASIVLVKIMKRRTLLLTSGAVSVVLILIVSLFNFLRMKSVISENFNVISFILLCLYLIVINAGCMPICFTLVGELFPLEHRSVASSMSGAIVSILMFVTIKIAPVMLETINVYGTFFVFGITMAACLVTLYFTLPETKDKTLQEIEDHFNDRPVRTSGGVTECKGEGLDFNVKLLK